MGHLALTHVFSRCEQARSESDFTYFWSLLLAGEALTKTIALGVVSAIADDKDRNRYRLEHQLVRSNGLGDWGRALEDALSGPASQYLLTEAREEQAELARAYRTGDWQYDAVASLKEALVQLAIDAEEVPTKTDMKRWFRLFATLRNGTRAHGATLSTRAAVAAEHLSTSIALVYSNFRLFTRPWAHLYRNLSGKYRVSGISEDTSAFAYLASERHHQLPNGVYVFMGGPRPVSLLHTNAEIQDFFFPNGGFSARKYELLSYFSDNKLAGDATAYLTPPGVLPASETEGHGTLVARGNCWSNAPDPATDYVSRPTLEAELLDLLQDDRRPIVTLVGRGGIGKTSIALKVLQQLYAGSRFEGVVWLSARDVDLQLTGPKPVRPTVLSADDMGRLYADLVLSTEQARAKDFKPRAFLEQQLQRCDLGPCLFVFDNFETTANPLEMFSWVDAYVRLPNKALITTRRREFKGDYPVEVRGMEEREARVLVVQVAASLGISHLVTSEYERELIGRSEAHPYVMKVLLGEVARAGRAANIPQLVAGTEDVLTALFERTYAALSPCAQRAFLTLAAWNSPVPRLALEAVLFRSTEERQEVERGIESLLQFSLAESHSAPADQQDFIGLPLVATVFGKKKLNINPAKFAILADAEMLQMLGPSRRDDVHLGLAKRLERFLGNIAQRIDAGATYESFAPILEAICRAYNPGWLLLARWHMEERTDASYERAKAELQRFLENGPPEIEAAEAWDLLGIACYRTGERLGEVHALIERAQLSDASIHELSTAANRLNAYLKDQGIAVDKEQRMGLAGRVVALFEAKRAEADAGDYSRMAWLAISSGQESLARDYVAKGLALDSDNVHIVKLSQRLGMAY